MRKARKAVTLVELIVLLIVLTVLSSIIVPYFSKVIRRMQVSEAYGIVSLIILGARTYDAKYGIANFTVSGDTTDWEELKISMPNGTKCGYKISVSGTDKLLTVYSKPDCKGDRIYTYTLPYGGSTINAANPDHDYLGSMP